MSHTELPLFDAHFHIVDPRFPLVPNRGYLPDRYTVSDYRARMEDWSTRSRASARALSASPNCLRPSATRNCRN